MIKFLPFILLALLILGGLGYWRFFATKQSLENPQTQVSQELVEVPKTAPGASLEDKFKSLEETVTALVNKVNAIPKPTTDPSLDSRLKSAESGVTELKARVSSLENATPAPAATSSKSTVYIPLGSGGQTTDTNWTSLNSFQINLDPAQYPGYKNMQLEVNMRLNQPGGTLFARLYNLSSGSSVSSEITTTSTTSSTSSSQTFTLPSGSKSYVLQAKTSDGTLGFLDNARIKVNF